MRILSYTPPYNHQSGGVRVVHRWAYLAKKLGYNSFIWSIGNQEYDTPSWQPEWSLEKDDIVVYPCHMGCKNPLGAKNVVRYILGYLPMSYGMVPKSEYSMPFSERYYDSAQQHTEYEIPKDNICFMPCIERGLFKPGEKTIDSAFYVGKGILEYDRSLVPADSIEITRTWPSTRQELANLLGCVKTFYSFDFFTAITDEARTAGCDVWQVAKGKEKVRPLSDACMFMNSDEEDMLIVKKQIERFIPFLGC